jgi:hypothetical protein
MRLALLGIVVSLLAMESASNSKQCHKIFVKPVSTGAGPGGVIA